MYEMTGRQIPPGGLPLHVDCVVDNVETIINVANAVDGTPVTEKYMTMAGAVPTRYDRGTDRHTDQECLARPAAARSTIRRCW